MVAVAAAQAVEHVGMPECALNLSQAAAYLALAPKSNASTPRSPAPAPTSGARAPRTRPPTFRTRTIPARRNWAAESATSIPHNLPDGVSDQTLMPEGMEDRRYYEPTERGFEAKLRERLAAIWRKQRKSGISRTRAQTADGM